MNKRLKLLRKKLGLTQQEFAERVGIKRGAIANYEIGRNQPIDAVISLICREFNVSETWLRTGEGEMFIEKPKTVSLDDLAQKKNATELELAIMKAYFEIDPNIRKKLVEYFTKYLASKVEISDSEEKIEQEADEAVKKADFLKMAEEQYDLEKKQEQQASSANGQDAV